jgi:hypothetical protein
VTKAVPAFAREVAQPMRRSFRQRALISGDKAGFSTAT